MKEQELSVFWFRRDLRLEDNHGLHKALESGLAVLPVFIFDTNILDDLSNPSDARLSFIHDVLSQINSDLKKKGSTLQCYYTTPAKAFETIFANYNVKAIYTNNDYEPYALERDREISALAEQAEISFYSFKDQVLFEKGEILKEDDSPYLVYTPYSKKWLGTLRQEMLSPYPCDSGKWFQSDFKEIIPLEEMGFKRSSIQVPSPSLSKETLQSYADERDFPAKDSTSHLSVHLRFGTVSVRKAAREAQEQSLTFLKELIWREFFMMILYHYPQVVKHNFNRKYDAVEWSNKRDEFEKWKQGETGYLLVDAGMRELNETGFMHNRVRMVVASFLSKHLLIDWRWGEAYFAEKLLDYDLSANNGNWQWAAGTGVDAAPYFRVFNPITQIDKFDPQRIYIRRWVKDAQSPSYPPQMVEHKMARERALETYKNALQNA
jgi:deoxyribodipyrimidine photo-lyase